MCVQRLFLLFICFVCYCVFLFICALIIYLFSVQYCNLLICLLLYLFIWSQNNTAKLCFRKYCGFQSIHSQNPQYFLKHWINTAGMNRLQITAILAYISCCRIEI